MKKSEISQENKYLVSADVALNTIGFQRFKKILNAGISFEDLWSQPTGELRGKLPNEKFVDRLLEAREKIEPDKVLERLGKKEVKFITILDEKYPDSLKEIYSPPIVIYYRGDISLLHDNLLAVVGSRKFTSYGKNAAEKIVYDLADAGYIIASGLALGIDTVAHEATLSAKGKTVAVLGCGPDITYPYSNAGLYKRILDTGGLIMSELMPGKPPLRQHFPARNRIISGLSRGILIVEGGVKSGALITARDGLEQNKDIFVIPGPIFSESSKGTNQLLKMGANLVTDADDVFEYYGFERKIKRNISKPANAVEEAIFEALKESENHIDQIIKSSGIEAQKIISTLTLMEIKGKVKNLGGMVYALA